MPGAQSRGNVFWVPRVTDAVNWVDCQKRQHSVGERAKNLTLRSSNIVGGREEATVAKETEGKSGRDIERRQESVDGEAKVVSAGCECPGALRAAGHPVLGDRDVPLLFGHTRLLSTSVSVISVVLWVGIRLGGLRRWKAQKQCLLAVCDLGQVT